MSTNTILFGVLFLLVAVAIFFVIRIEMRMRRLFEGSKAQSLEALMHEVVTRVKVLYEASTHHDADIRALEHRITKHGRGVKLVRFNPFPDVGGNQSFAVAIINEEGDGVVFSSLYSRERMSVFAKPIAGGTSDIELTEEERTVVAEAQKDAQTH